MTSAPDFYANVWRLFTEIGAVAQPVVDYHQHLFLPAVTGFKSEAGRITANELVAYLDAAGILRKQPAPLLYPSELARCAHDPQLHYGIKLHFGDSDVDLDNSEHVRLLRLFREAKRRRMAIVVHIPPSVTHPYGAKEARVFLGEILPAAPRVPVQIAHLSGAGGYDDPKIDEALCVFVDAIAKHDHRMAEVYFDISGIAGVGQWKEKGELIASRVRQLGLNRVLYGSDGATPGLPRAILGHNFGNCRSPMQNFGQSNGISLPI